MNRRGFLGVLAAAVVGRKIIKREAPRFEISSGSLPPGLTIDSNTGTVSGTPTVPGDFGISIRMIRTYDRYTDNYQSRLDVLYGMTEIKPEYSCRIAA